MDSSRFSDAQPRFEAMELLTTSQGATCDAYRVKLYGKLHFLKRLKPQFAGDIRYQEALRKEFETGYRLEHPNLVCYISLESDGILMEYVDGETLSRLLESRPDYFRRKKNCDRFLHQLLDAVAYLHAHQVLHLDLKPDNILLTRINDDVKLVDLGCCYTDAFVDTQGHTDSFAAPEQLSGGVADARTDIYAIGKLLELLPNHSIYNKVITRCTAPAPHDRYQSIGDLLCGIRQRRRHTRYLASLAALVVAIVLGVAFLSHWQQSATEHEREMVADSVSSEDHVTDSVSEANNPSPVLATDALSQTPEKDEQTLCMEEIVQLTDKAYRSTICNFRDSVWPPRDRSMDNPWADASTAFHDQVVQIGDSLSKKYPTVPESTIRQEIESRFQSLVGYVFNKMRENGGKVSD